MKRIIPLLLFLFLTGCGGSNSQMNRALNLRSTLEKGSGSSFSCTVTADYGDKLYTFGMDCVTDQQGNLTFTVTAPETIAGITGSVSQNSGKLTFDQTALAFELLADGLPSPVSAPWMLIRTLRSGYITSVGSEPEGLRLSIDENYEEDAVKLEIWLNDADLPAKCEFVWNGRRILSLEIKNFTIL